MSDQKNSAPGTELTKNLGTSPKKLAKMEIDRRMFSNLEEDEMIFVIFNDLGAKLGNVALEIVNDSFLHHKISVNALGMRYAIKGEQVRKGIAANSDAEPPTHNRFYKMAKTLINPNWEAEEEKKRVMQNNE